MFAIFGRFTWRPQPEHENEFGDRSQIEDAEGELNEQ